MKSHSSVADFPDEELRDICLGVRRRLLTVQNSCVYIYIRSIVVNSESISTHYTLLRAKVKTFLWDWGTGKPIATRADPTQIVAPGMRTKSHWEIM